MRDANFRRMTANWLLNQAVKVIRLRLQYAVSTLLGLHPAVVFAFVGGFSTGLHYALLIALKIGLDINATVATSIGYVVSAVFNYWLNRWLTFRSTRAHREALPRFMLTAALGLMINSSIVWVLNGLAGVHYLIAQVFATGATLFWNYGLNKYWTFRKTGGRQHEA